MTQMYKLINSLHILPNSSLTNTKQFDGVQPMQLKGTIKYIITNINKLLSLFSSLSYGLGLLACSNSELFLKL
jgi:hypothetical protein